MSRGVGCGGDGDDGAGDGQQRRGTLKGSGICGNLIRIQATHPATIHVKHPDTIQGIGHFAGSEILLSLDFTLHLTWPHPTHPTSYILSRDYKADTSGNNHTTLFSLGLGTKTIVWREDRSWEGTSTTLKSKI